MSLEIAKYNVKIQLVEDMLGTVPKNEEVYAAHVQNKGRELIEKQAKKGVPLASGAEASPDAVTKIMEEELDTIEDIEERGWTGFHKDESGIFIHDYLVKGAHKEAARTLKTWGQLKQLQDKFSRYCFVSPRRVRFEREGKVVAEPEGVLERPLRAMTAQGPRVTVARSDIVKAGATLSYQLSMLDGSGLTAQALRDILSYGELQGLGQWRSGGYGRFTVLSFGEA